MDIRSLCAGWHCDGAEGIAVGAYHMAYPFGVVTVLRHSGFHHGLQGLIAGEAGHYVHGPTAATAAVPIGMSIR